MQVQFLHTTFKTAKVIKVQKARPLKKRTIIFHISQNSAGQFKP